MRMRRLRWLLITGVGALALSLAAVAAVQEEPAAPAAPVTEPGKAR